MTGITSTLPGASGGVAQGVAQYRYAFDYLGRRTWSIDPDTGRTYTVYDAASNPVKVVDAANAAAGLAVGTSYDRWNRPVARTQTGTRSTKTLATWTYDSAPNGKGRPATQTSYTPLGTFTTKAAAYDARGQVTKSTQGYPAALTGESGGSDGQASKSVTLAYNQAGMETTRVHPGVPDTTYNSGALTQATSYTSGGHLARIESRSLIADIPLGVASYDKYNRPAQLVSGKSASALIRRYGFNPATGDLTGISASDVNGLQMSLAYSYDAAGRPIKVTGTQPTSPSIPNSAQTTAAWCYRYDAINRLTRATTGKTATVSGNTSTCAGAADPGVTGASFDLSYTFDHTRLASISDRTTGTKATYQHTNPAHPHALTATITTGPAAAVATANGLLPVSGALTYDPSGRAVTTTVANPTAPGVQTSDGNTGAGAGGGATSTTYDALGNPTKIAPLSGTGTGSGAGSGLSTTQAFDAGGIRVARQDKTADGQVTSTVFLNGLDITHTQGQDSRALTRYFATPSGTPIATRDDKTATNFLFTDPQQNIRLVKTNVSLTHGALSTHTYTPYGNPFTTRTKPTTTTGSTQEPGGPGAAPKPGDHAYLNKTHDPGGDLRLDHRSYTPTLGTLTTPDLLLDLADPQNLNPYSYAGNNPIGFADPSGLAATCVREGTCTYQANPTGPPTPIRMKPEVVQAQRRQDAATAFVEAHDEWAGQFTGDRKACSPSSTTSRCGQAESYRQWLHASARLPQSQRTDLQQSALNEWTQLDTVREDGVTDAIISTVATAGLFGIVGALRGSAAALFTGATEQTAAKTEGVLVEGAGSGTRSLNFRPNASDPNWGLTGKHLDKHLFGDGSMSLRSIDPGGTTDDWVGYMQDLAGRPATATLKGGIEDIIGTFPRAGGGSFQFGIRIAPGENGSWDLVTLLTKQ